MQHNEFLGGVVEGFYGEPWTHRQRLQLHEQLATVSLNTYFYAPKDDLKHRAIWRELYDDAELALIRELAQTCEQHGLNFIYGLSPGLDMCFSEPAETNRIKARFDQLGKVGVRHFALLFDDLSGQLGDHDRRAYPSLAAAHCDVTIPVFTWVREHFTSARFLFCPTPYCDRMDREQLGGSGYLDEVGRLLSPEIDLLWAGPEIVSEEIPVDSIERLSKRIHRPPVIWDNLFANDYDFRRLHCGPYTGRKRDLCRVTRGILVNPNNEYLINFIPLRTLAAFLSNEDEWMPRKAFLKAAAEWLAHYDTVGYPFTLDDLVLLVDCFYLPYAEGPEAQRLLQAIDRLLVQPVSAWGDAYAKFSAMNRRIQSIFDHITELRDRELFRAWSRYGWNLKEELQIIDAVLAQKKSGRDMAEGFQLGTHLPGTYRGGLIAKLERFLGMDAQGVLRPSVSTSSGG